MPHSYYIVHLEEKADESIYAQLRCFAYPGAFASSVYDEFNVKEQFPDIEWTVREIVSHKMGLKTIVRNKRLREFFGKDYLDLTEQCKKIFIKRNPNIDVNKIQ